MNTLNTSEKGSLVAPLVIVVVLLLGSLGFGGWAYMSMQDYKLNSDKKSDAAVEQAVKLTSDKKDVEFQEKEKSPLKTYNGPAAYGSVVITYPKTWSAYVDETNKSPAIDGYFNPNFVPSIVTNTPSQFALRIQVVSDDYAQNLKVFDSIIKSGSATLSAYRLPKVPDALGSMITGALDSTGKKTGVMVLLPLRDKTIKIWTEGNSFRGDFNDTILANLTFVK